MKLKRLVEDFQVEEQTTLHAVGGPFAVYRLTKQSLGTLEAIDAICRRWNLPRENVALAGLKDKHALTTQYLTVRGGPRRGLTQSNLELHYIGQAEKPIHASDIAANCFSIVIRNLDVAEVNRVTHSLVAVGRDGVPNYFDNQRFGSLGESGEFIAKPWCLGNYERTLWLALAEENVHDRREECEQKRVLREHWGDWSRCLEQLPRSPTRDVIARLAAQPGDFRRALGWLRHDLRSLWLAAYQSHLWNQVLAELFCRVCRPEQRLSHRIGQRDVPFFADLDDSQRQQLRATSLPLPSARLHLEAGELKSLYDQVLAADGMELRQIRVKYPRDSFFSKGERAAIFGPGEFRHQWAADELYPGHQKLSLHFTLARGSYATIVVKRIVGDIDVPSADED